MQGAMFGEAIETKFADEPSVSDDDAIDLVNGPEVDTRSESSAAESVAKPVHKVNGICVCHRYLLRGV